MTGHCKEIPTVGRMCLCLILRLSYSFTVSGPEILILDSVDDILNEVIIRERTYFMVELVAQEMQAGRRSLIDQKE